jgi:hypothetical protein
VTTNARISQVAGLLARAELVRVSVSGDGQISNGDQPQMRIVVRSGNSDLRTSLGNPTPDGVATFPMPLHQGELELEFGDGCPGVMISSRSEPPRSWQGADEPEFQTWLERQVEKARLRAGANRPHALQSATVRAKGTETQWSAIFEPGQVGLSSPQRDAVTALSE